MIQILIIMFIIVFIELLVLGLIFSRISIRVNKLDIAYDEIDTKKLNINEFEIFVKFYLFKYLKIVSIKIYKDYLKVFNIKINFSLLRKFKVVEENYKKAYSSLKLLIKNREKINFQLLKPKVYSFKLEFELGTFSQMFTTFMIPAISTSIAVILNSLVKKINPEEYNFKITPKYLNRNVLQIKFNSKITFSSIKLIFFIISLKNIIKENKTEKSLVLVKKSKLKKYAN